MQGGTNATLSVGAEASFEAHAEPIDDGEEVKNLLAYFAREGGQARVRGHDPTVRVRIVGLDEAGHTLLLDASHAELDADVVTLELDDAHMVYAFTVRRLFGDWTRVPIPNRVIKLRRRAFRRVAAPLNLRISLLGLDGVSVRAEARVHDLSRRGLSFDVHASNEGLEVGERLRARLRDGEGRSGRVTAIVRSQRAHGELTRVGILLEDIDQDASSLLTHHLERALYPSTHRQAVDVWDVHTSSGYLSLSGKQPAEFERLRHAYLDATRKLEHAPSVASVAYWPSEGRTDATISHFKVFQSSWLVCQLSKRKGEETNPESRRGLREMYLRIYESAHADPDTRWLLTYIQDAAPSWSRKVHVGVPERFTHNGDGCLVPFRALETDVRVGFSAPSSAADVRVVDADPALGAAVMRDLHRLRPAQYLDALDFTEERWSLSVPRARWNAAGLARERHVLVAMDGETRVAMAVLELAEPGVHLYGLLDCLRLYPLRPSGARAFPQLLARAHHWFHAHGRDQFAYMEEWPGSLPVFDLGFRDLGGATLTMLSIDRLPELMQRVADLSSQRPPMRHDSEVLRKVRA